MYFSRQMSVFLKAGIPILESLEAISEEMGNKNLKRTLADISTRLQCGETFAAAAAAHPDAFPAFYLGVLRTAELTGKLDTTLLRLSENIDRDLEAKKKVTAALVYPAIIMVMAVVVVLLLTIVVLPKFEVFFQSLDAKLPLVDADAPRYDRRSPALVAPDLGAMAVIALVVGFCLATEPRARHPRPRDPARAGDWRPGSVRHPRPVLPGAQYDGHRRRSPSRRHASHCGRGHQHRLPEGLDNCPGSDAPGRRARRPARRHRPVPGGCAQMFRVGESAGTMDEQLAASAEYFDREARLQDQAFHCNVRAGGHRLCRPHRWLRRTGADIGDVRHLPSGPHLGG